MVRSNCLPPTALYLSTATNGPALQGRHGRRDRIRAPINTSIACHPGERGLVAAWVSMGGARRPVKTGLVGAPVELRELRRGPPGQQPGVRDADEMVVD